MFLDIIDYFLLGDPEEKFHGQFFTYSAIAFMDIDLVAAWVYMSVAAPMAGEAGFDPSGMLFAGIDGLIVAVVAALFIPAALRIRKRSGRPATFIHLMLVIASSLCLAAWAWMAMP